MNWDGHLPDDWYGVAGLVVVGLVILVLAQAVGGAAIFKYHHDNNKAAVKDRRELKAETAEIKEQVVNSHTDIGLRDDLDRLTEDLAAMKSDIRELVAQMAEWSPLIPLVRSFAPEIKALRQDIAEERESRRNLAADVRADLSRNRDEVTDLHRRLRDASK